VSRHPLMLAPRTAKSRVVLDELPIRKCIFFRERTLSLRCAGNEGGATISTQVKLAWCAHSETPVNEERAGGDRMSDVLWCGGDKSKCPIPETCGGFKRC
jgi:hypothetical protein